MDQSNNLVPKDKADIERARAATMAGYPAVGPILGESLWSGSGTTIGPSPTSSPPFLASVGVPLAPHIWRVLRGDDEVWKYWGIGLLIRSFPEDVAEEFRPELDRLCHHPLMRERIEELDTQAQDVLEHFGWFRKHNPDCAL